MDIFSYLKKDHQEIKGLLEKATNARSPEKRSELLRKLKEAVLLHAKTEEATFYAALYKRGMDRKMDHAKKEHKEVEDLFLRMSRTAKDSDKLLILLGEVKMGLEHHIEEEETEIFEKARSLLDSTESQLLAEKMQEMKEEQPRKVA